MSSEHDASLAEAVAALRAAGMLSRPPAVTQAPCEPGGHVPPYRTAHCLTGAHGACYGLFCSPLDLGTGRAAAQRCDCPCHTPQARP